MITTLPSAFDELRRKIAEGQDDIVHGRVLRINNEAESRAYAEEIKVRGRARLQADVSEIDGGVTRDCGVPGTTNEPMTFE